MVTKFFHSSVPPFLSSLVLKFFSFLVLAFFSFCLLPVESEASIVLKIMAVNPSNEQVQTVPVKAYLPKEIKPEDIVDKSDLEIVYDTQQGSYYVYGEYMLKPSGVVEKEIELRDIWLIPNTEVESLRLEVIKMEAVLKNTEFAERIAFLKNSIEYKLNQIIENQKSSPPNHERHISDYRENLKVLEAVKADLVLARSLLSQVKPLPYAVVWKVIVAIVIFLGVLGISFYFIWQRQVKTITQEDTFYIPNQPQAEGKEKPEKPAGDVEKILGEEKPKEET